MAWVKLDDQARHHRKILSVGPIAAWMWTCGLMYCNSQKARDGFIPEAAVPVLYPIQSSRKEAERLVASGLWERVDGGFVVHDYHDYQPTAEDAAIISERRAVAGRAGGLARAEAKRQQTASKPPANSKQSASKPPSKTLADGPSKSVARPDPDPVPIPTKEEIQTCVGAGAPVLSVQDPPGPKTRKPAKRGTKVPLPEDWQPPPADARRLASNDLSVTRVVEEFRSYRAEETRTLPDWNRAFANRVDQIFGPKGSWLREKFAMSATERMIARMPPPPPISATTMTEAEADAAYRKAMAELEDAATPRVLRDATAMDAENAARVAASAAGSDR